MPELRLSSDELVDLADGILKNGHILRFRAKGWSMWPFIRDGDLIEVKPIKIDEIRRADVLLYSWADERLVVHRVVRLQRDEGELRLLMQGDAQPSADGVITSVQVKGRVVAVERRDKRISMDALFLRFLARIWLLTVPYSRDFLRALAGIRRKVLSLSRNSDQVVTKVSGTTKVEE